MTLESGTRRGFLIGALALMTAPAIVRADSLMKVVPIDVYDTRCLLDYNPHWDATILRVDRSLAVMRRPLVGAREISIAEARHLVEKAGCRSLDFVFGLQPPPGVQKHFQVKLDFGVVVSEMWTTGVQS